MVKLMNPVAGPSIQVASYTHPEYALSMQATLEGLADGVEAKDAAALASAQAAKKSWEGALSADGEALRAAVVATMARQKGAPAGLLPFSGCL